MSHKDLASKICKELLQPKRKSQLSSLKWKKFRNFSNIDRYIDRYIYINIIYTLYMMYVYNH
jgi:hypothetical protein